MASYTTYNTALDENGHAKTQLAMLVEDLTRKQEADQTHTPGFSKAFDKVNHSKLIWILNQYGIRGDALNWISAFLGNRSQTVVLDGDESGSVQVTPGVPQGSVLDPILFPIYIND